jgi:hypothetical protein
MPDLWTAGPPASQWMARHRDEDPIRTGVSGVANQRLTTRPHRHACPRADSNRRQPGPEPDALSTALRGHGGSGGIRTRSDCAPVLQTGPTLPRRRTPVTSEPRNFREVARIMGPQPRNFRVVARIMGPPSYPRWPAAAPDIGHAAGPVISSTVEFSMFGPAGEPGKRKGDRIRTCTLFGFGDRCATDRAAPLSRCETTKNRPSPSGAGGAECLRYRCHPTELCRCFASSGRPARLCTGSTLTDARIIGAERGGESSRSTLSFQESRSLCVQRMRGPVRRADSSARCSSVPAIGSPGPRPVNSAIRLSR